MNRYFLEEKKNGLMPRVAPELSMETFWYYKNAHYIESEVVRARLWSASASYRSGTEHESLYYERVYVPKSVGSLYSCVGRRCENDLLYTFKKFGSGGM